MPRSANSDTTEHVLDGPHPVGDPGNREGQRRPDAVGAGPLAGVDRAPEAGVGGDREHLGELAGGESRLVAGHRETDDVRMRVPGRIGRHSQGLLDAEVPHGRNQDPALDPGVAAGVVDSPRDAVRWSSSLSPTSAAWSGEAVSST